MVVCVNGGLVGNVGLHLGAECELSPTKHAQRPEQLQVCGQQRVGLGCVWRRGVERGVEAYTKK